jgi:hypothetical protein
MAADDKLSRKDEQASIWQAKPEDRFLPFPPCPHGWLHWQVLMCEIFSA